jgi:hypothetical protein
MRGTSIVAVALAVMLMLSVSLTSGLTSVALPNRVESFFQFDWVQENLIKAHKALSRRCDVWFSDDKYCDALLYPLLFAHDKAWILLQNDIDKYLQSKEKNLSYLIWRSSIPKTELPVLHIHMTDGAIGKLKKKREITLREKSPILLRGPNDWVTAKIISDDGNNRKIYRVKIRLKGDLPDHLNNPKKLSFRIEAGNNRLIWGMSEFSIQRPAVRKYHYEALIQTMMRRIGVLAPRYFFVDVRINNRVVGIMALEEHFSNEMIEAQNRREGPILAIDDDWYWRQLFLCLNQTVRDCGNTLPRLFTNLSLKDYPVKVFRAGPFMPETIRGQQIIRAVSLFRDEIDERIGGDFALDLDLVSLWWVMLEMWKAEHGSQLNNRRYYFNPITGRLEPISFDNLPWHYRDRSRERYRWRTHQEEIPVWFFDAMNDLLHNHAFKKLVAVNIDKMEKLLDSNDFQEWFDSEQSRHLKVLSMGDMTPEPVLISELKRSLFEFSHRTKFLFSGTSILSESVEQLSDIDGVPIHGRKIMESGVVLYTHIRPFWFWSAEGMELEIKNLTLDPITIHSVFPSKEPKTNLLVKEIVIPVYVEGKTHHIFKSLVDASRFVLSDQIQVSYSYQRRRYTRPVFLQFRNHESGYESQELARAWFDENGVLMNQETKTITFPSGRYSLPTNLETEKGWRVEFLPGAVLEFKQGARLKVNGPVRALGRKDLPVKMIVNSDSERGLLGSWGGLLVLKAERESILRYTQVFGSAGTRLARRQDSYGLTGCVTFYKSDVRIEYSKFIGLQCEDALNIISSDFNIDYTEFVDASADAFDSDFSDGTISKSMFHKIVNDGIDLAGSVVQVSSSQFSNIRDKAISVGEDSKLDASELTVDGANAGVVSKDKSVVNIHNSSFENVNNALMAYVKKDEWGPAEIHCDGCLFDHVESVAVEQYASRITIDGKEVSPTPFSRKQLQIAGYTQ